MVRIAIALAVALYGWASAGAEVPPEDEAHRLDRLETKRLNEASALGAAFPTGERRKPKPDGTTPLETAAERALRAQEEQAIAEWRRRVAACQHGDGTAC